MISDFQNIDQINDLKIRLDYQKKTNKELRMLLEQNEQTNFDLEKLLKEHEKKIAFLEKKNDQNLQDILCSNEITNLQSIKIDNQCEQINVLKKENEDLKKKKVSVLLKCV
jgi:hypothetical protein